MVGFGEKYTPTKTDLHFSRVKILSIDKCIKDMYGESGTKIHDEKNVICVHGNLKFIFSNSI